MTNSNPEVGCCECGWQGLSDDRLLAENPFERSETIFGCPDCKETGCFRIMCDEPGCEEFVTCGTPTGDGYRNTCGRHRPK